MFIKFDNKSATCLQNAVISRSPFNLLLWLKVNIDGNLATSSFYAIGHSLWLTMWHSVSSPGVLESLVKPTLSGGEDAVASLSSRKID